MPLRGPKSITRRRKSTLKWLRRRWLCRIPRSHCTEGLRPLGRLALVDHGPELIGQLKQAISTMTSAEAIAASGRQLGQEILPAAPQIVLVASISGGTGSGMLLDAAYAVRKVLADLSLSDARLTGVLLHWTGRDPHGKLLARANACACLRELQSFGRGEGYPGDADFGLPAFAAEIPPFDATRVVHLGDGLNQEEFAEGRGERRAVPRPGHRDGRQRVVRLGPRVQRPEDAQRAGNAQRIRDDRADLWLMPDRADAEGICGPCRRFALP